MAGRRTPRDFSTEKGFQTEVLRIARRAGWTCNHTYKAKLRDGTWRTTTTLKGMPDLTLIKPGRLGFLELKKPGEHPSPEQEAVVALLQTVPGVFAHIVWPADWPMLMDLLTGT